MEPRRAASRWVTDLESSPSARSLCLPDFHSRGATAMTWKLDADGLWTDALADMRKQADTARWDMPAEGAKEMDAAIEQMAEAVSLREQEQGGVKIEGHGHASR